MNKLIIKIFGLEYNELVLVIFFNIIFFFIAYSIIVIFFTKNYIYKYKKIIIFLSIFPLFFLLLSIFNFFQIGEWLGFLGGYLGVIGTVFSVLWQNEMKEKEKRKQLNKYIEYIFQENIQRIDSNFKNYQEYFYDQYRELLFIENIEVRKNKFLFMNFNDSFIENNFEYILTLENSKYIIQLYNTIKEINKLLHIFLLSCEKREKDFLEYFEYLEKREMFIKEIEDSSKQPYNEYTKELFPNGLKINIKSIFDDYSCMLFLNSRYFGNLKFLDIDSKIMYAKKYANNSAAISLKLDTSPKQFYKEVISLDKSNKYIFNLKYN